MNLTAKFGLDVTDFVSGLSKIENQSDRSFASVQREMAKLQNSSQRLLDSLKSPFEKLQDKLTKIKAPDIQKDQLFAAFDENEMLKGVVASEKMLQTIRLQAEEYGKTSAEVQRLRLVRAGANAEQLKEFDTIQKNIQAMQEQRQATDALAAAEQRRKQTMTSLIQAAKGFVIGAVAVGGVRSVFELADGYSQLTAQLRNVSSSSAEVAYVQERLSQNAKTTYRSLQEATQSYLNLSGSLKTIGYNTKEVLDFNDSLTYAFTASGTSADNAQTAINALSRSFAKGSIDGKSWTLILQGVPSIAKQVAEYTGKSEEEIRKLGVTGKISVNMLVESLSAAKDANQALADSMSISLRDGFTYLKNSLSEYLGQTNNAYSVTNTLAQGLKVLGDNIGLLVKITTMWLGLKAVGYIKTMTVALFAKTAAMYKSVTAITAETAAVTANSKAWAANALARTAGGIGGVKGLNNRAIGGIATAAGAAIGGGAVAGTVGILASGLVSFFDSILFLLGKRSNTIAGSFADGLTKFFSDGKYLSLGDFAYSKLSKQGRAEERAYQEQLKQQLSPENSLSGDYKNLRSGLQDLGEEITKQTEQFNKSTLSMRLAEKRLKLDDMKAKGTDTNENILKLERELKELELRNQQNINQQGVEYIQKLKEQQAAIGKTNDELDLMKLSAAGVNTELIEQARLNQLTNKKLLDNLAVQEKIKNLQEETAKIGKSERELFSADILKKLGIDKPFDLSQTDIKKQLGDSYQLYADALKAFDDKALKEKTTAELNELSADKFSAAVDKFADKDKTSEDAKWDAYFAKLDKMSYAEQQEFFKQEQLALPSYSSVTAKQFDDAAAQAAESLANLNRQIEENRMNSRIESITKQAGLYEPSIEQAATLDPLSNAVSAETTALLDNTAAIREQTAVLQTQATAQTMNAQNQFAPQTASQGSLTLFIATDTEKHAVQIFGSQAAVDFARRVFSSGSEYYGLTNAR